MTERKRDWLIIERPTPRDRRLAVVNRIATEHGLTAQDLLGPCRQRKVAHPRFAAMATIRRQFGDSTPQIARLFGNRDHTSVLHAIRRAEQLGLVN